MRGGGLTFAMIATLRVWEEGRRFAGVKLSQPTQISSYSKDDGGVHCPALPSALRRFRNPKVGSKLGEGFELFVPKRQDDGESSLDPVIEAMHGAGLPSGVHFVSFRNNLNKIMETPYNKRDEWRIDMHRVSGTIFLKVVKLDGGQFGAHGESQDKFMYWGYKFEELCTRGEGAEAGKVDANVEFCSVFKLAIGDSRLVLGAEIDCYEGGEDEGSNAAHSAYVEIKTSRVIEHPGQGRSFERFKMLKYWIQSFLAGVPTICVGFRDDAGVLCKVQKFKTLELPRFVRGKKDGWDPQICIDFTARVLDMLREKTEDGCQYSLQYAHPFEKVQLNKLDLKPEDSFLPREYR